MAVDEAIASFHAGRHAEATSLCQRVLAAQPDNPDALHLLGVIALEAGDSQTAVKLIGQAVEQRPDAARLHNNLGNALCAVGDLDSAVAAYHRAIEIDPSYAMAHSHLGNALRLQFKFDDALNAHGRALALGPERAEAHNDLGNVYQDLGRSEDAIASYRHAIGIRPDYSEAHNNLGNALLPNDRLEDAIACYHRAIECDPKSVLPYTNLGNALRRRGDIIAAISSFQRAVQLAPSDPLVLHNAAQCLRGAQFTEADDALRATLVRCFECQEIDRQQLSEAAASMLRQMPGIRALIAECKEGDPVALASAVRDGRAARSLRDRLLILLLESTIVTDVALEGLLTAVRHTLLRLALSEPTSSPLHDEWAAFACALARQCFINEYVFFQTADEAADVETLRARVEAGLAASNRVSGLEIALLAAYLPLHAVDGAETLAANRAGLAPVVAGLVVQQITEPLTEAEIARELASPEAISDDVSRRVRAQYEANPYPRWSDVPYRRELSLAANLRQDLPHVPPAYFRFPANPRVLMAGCGTGRNAVVQAKGYAGAQIVAFDLSRASLAFGLRKARELGLRNIRFLQHDLLDAGELGGDFDLIECSGVLHHLGDPLLGWRVLVGMLRPGGFMRIGLYSEAARQGIVAAKAFIATRGFEPTVEGIRQCRRELMAFAADEPARDAVNWRDFYTTSACRDLLFHVQEGYFTLPRIAECCDRLGLEFLGFRNEDEDVARNYKTRFRDDPAAVSLDNWHTFELENPHIFRNMYQFWLRKPE